MALRLPSSRLAFDADTSYWIGAKHKRPVCFRVNVSRLNQLVAAARVPYEVHASGRRLYRREQIATIAHAQWH